MRLPQLEEKPTGEERDWVAKCPKLPQSQSFQRPLLMLVTVSCARRTGRSLSRDDNTFQYPGWGRRLVLDDVFDWSGECPCRQPNTGAMGKWAQVCLIFFFSAQHGSLLRFFSLAYGEKLLGRVWDDPSPGLGGRDAVGVGNSC